MSSIESQVGKLVAERAAALARATQEKEARNRARASLRHATAAQKIAQDIAQRIQASAHKQIADVVTRCLAAVFDDPYEFEIEFEKKRGKTEARLWLRRAGRRADPLTATGGGVVDVAAFALRLAALVLTRPARRRLLVLDEPFRFVSAGLRPRVRAMLGSLAEELGVQFIMVTHIPELVTGTVIEVQ